MNVKQSCLKRKQFSCPVLAVCAAVDVLLVRVSGFHYGHKKYNT